jgi:hypothetical protein
MLHTKFSVTFSTTCTHLTLIGGEELICKSLGEVYEAAVRLIEHGGDTEDSDAHRAEEGSF